MLRKNKKKKYVFAGIVKEATVIAGQLRSVRASSGVVMVTGAGQACGVGGSGEDRAQQQQQRRPF